MKYKKLALGGTFDHFHRGHELFITQAASLSQHIVIGVTTDGLITHKKMSKTIQPYAVRVSAVENFCKKNSLSFEILPLTDIYGPTLSNEGIEALFATEDTLSGAEVINEKREILGLRKLHIEKVSLARDRGGQVISSERIRSGEIDRDGQSFKIICENDYHIGPDFRNFLSKPQGKVVSEPDENDNIRVAVGDTTLENFILKKWYFSLGIYDLLKRRAPYESKIIASTPQTQVVNNPPQYITKELSTAIINSYQTDGSLIKVIGEEDLAAVAAVILLPLGTAVYYGQPDLGMVRIVVTEEKKAELFQFLQSSTHNK